jgi:ABC-type nitrate/sulfonate/bicarbonate transport system substrate-binding protein
MLDRRATLKGLGAGIALGIAGFGNTVRAQPSSMPVRSALAAPGLSFAGLYVAKRRELWTRNGVDMTLKLVQGGPLAMVALTTQEADFVSTASTDPMIGWDRGLKTVVIAAFTGALTMQFTARKEWMERSGAGPKSPLEAKVKALKGARVGVSTIGGGPAQYTRHLATMFGIDPERDMKLLAVGFGPARIAALRQNQVDLITGSPPEADQVFLEGFGDLFLNCATEVPLFREFPFTVALVTAQTAGQRSEMTSRIGRTLGQANDLIHSNFGEVVDILRSEFPKIDPRAIERSMERDKDSFPQGARMTETMWHNGIVVSSALKTIKNSPPEREGEFWTNKFLQ